MDNKSYDEVVLTKANQVRTLANVNAKCPVQTDKKLMFDSREKTDDISKCNCLICDAVTSRSTPCSCSLVC